MAKIKKDLQIFELYKVLGHATPSPHNEYVSLPLHLKNNESDVP